MGTGKTDERTGRERDEGARGNRGGDTKRRGEERRGEGKG
jgi:hypothetical protein